MPKIVDDDIHVAIKSKGRAGSVTTHKVVPDASIWVPESEAEEYRRNYGDAVVAIPDDSDGSLCRKSNSILDRSPRKWTLILDDDITSINMFEDGKHRVLDEIQVARLINHHFDLADQLGIRLWGINQNNDPLSYRQSTPFSFLAPVLGPFNGHLEPELRYDESVLGKDDYDFWLQNIRRYHRTLRINKYFYHHDHGTKKGGFVSMRSFAVEVAGVRRMQEKWGRKIFRTGGSGGANRDRETNTEGNILNAVVKVPIAGV